MPSAAARVVLAIFSLFAFACTSAPPQEEVPWSRYELRGEVVDLQDGETKIARIDHETIEGFMDAMTMAFPVRDPAEFAKLTVGARIEATVAAKGYSEYYLEDIRVLEDETPVSDMEN